jgi:hypothetical protein
MSGPYPIYEPDDENAQNFPMPGDNPVPPLESSDLDYDDDTADVAGICPGCGGTGFDDWVMDTCGLCGGSGEDYGYE